MSRKAIKGSSDYFKDEKSGAILFINRREVQRQKEKLRAMKEERQRVESLESEVAELKSLITQLLENNKHG